MTSANVNSTCQEQDLVNTCVGDSKCKYSITGPGSDKCVVTTLTGCGRAMADELSQAICKSNNPRDCRELFGVYAYTPNYIADGSACGVEDNNWCAQGTKYADRYALCASKTL